MAFFQLNFSRLMDKNIFSPVFVSAFSPCMFLVGDGWVFMAATAFYDFYYLLINRVFYRLFFIIFLWEMFFIGIFI